jgi:hypothetical protein
LSRISLKDRPIGPDDFVDDGDKLWGWALAPLAVAIVVKIAISVFGFRRGMDSSPFELGWFFLLYRFDIVLYLVLAIFALRTYR